MKVFVDTSAFLALIDQEDPRHAAADRAWQKALSAGEDLVTSNYVLVELHALVQRRFGMKVLGVVATDLLAPVRVAWIDEEVHEKGVAAMLGAGKRKLGLVDCTSFAIMQRDRIRHAFAYDRHFTERGFRRYA